MKSPITGKEMKLVREERPMVFRKETFEVVYHSYLCEDSGEQFTTSEMDELNLSQLYNKYRDKANIPFPDEIQRIRMMYGLSAVKMSNILGLGDNTYGKYESGEMPTVASARLIQMAADPTRFVKLVELCDSLPPESRIKLLRKIDSLIAEREHKTVDCLLKGYLLGSHLADIYSGFRNPSFEKFSEMVVFFAEKVKPFKTKINKLLFYSDFSSFRKSGFSISGMRYLAIERGPVPHNFQGFFEFLQNEHIIDIENVTFPDGYSGDRIVARRDRPFNKMLFSSQELAVLNEIVDKLHNTTTKDIIAMSHREEGWIQNKDTKGQISYEYAFILTQV